MAKSNKDANICNVRYCRNHPNFGYVHNDHHYRVCQECFGKYERDELRANLLKTKENQ